MSPRRWGAAGALALALALLGPAAHGHDELVSSTPRSGEILADPPRQVVLTMSAEPLEIGTVVMVTDPAGVDHATGLSFSGNDVVVDLAELPEGFYDVRWRVVSSDGHPISGLIPFTVGDVGPRPSAGALPPTSDATTSSPGSSPSVESTPSTPSAGSADAGTRRGIGRTLGTAAAGAVGALVLWWTVSRLSSLRSARRSHPN